MGPAIQGNPLKIFVYLLVISYVLGEFIIPKYPIIYLFNMIGLIAGGHWYEGRSEEELINSGAFTVIKEFKYLDNILGTM